MVSMQVEDTGGRVYLTSKQVRARYGNVSDMSLWRWSNDANLGFPQPMTVNGRRFWALDELKAWEASRAKTEGGANVHASAS